MTKKEIIQKLNSIGRIDKDTDLSLLLDQMNSTDPDVLVLVLKNLAKIQTTDYSEYYLKTIKESLSSLVRREAVSALGRMRNEKNKNHLIKLLKDQDPNIVLQAIRGLLVFKENKEIEKKLKVLIRHPNELVQMVIQREFFSNKKIENLSPEKKQEFENVLFEGDSLKVLKKFPKELIDLTFTSPPYYNARDYSIYKSYDEYLKFLNNIFKQIHDKTKEGRFLIVNTSPVILPRFSREYSSKRYPIPFDLNNLLIKMGWEFVDDIVWIKPEASVINRNGVFQQNKKPLTYKPNCVNEYIMVYRKKTDKLLDWNIKQYDQKIVEDSLIKGDFESSNVWKIKPVFDKLHSAPFPRELCDLIVKYYSYKGDLVFDPFAGIGTLASSAYNLGRLSLLIEKSPEYCQEILKRMPFIKMK